MILKAIIAISLFQTEYISSRNYCRILHLKQLRWFSTKILLPFPKRLNDLASTAKLILIGINVDYARTTSAAANVVSVTVIIVNVKRLAATVTSKILLNFVMISSLTSVIVQMNTLLFVILVKTGLFCQRNHSLVFDLYLVDNVMLLVRLSRCYVM